MNRVLIGLSVGSGLEGADAAVVRVAGVGLGLAPQVARTARVVFPPSARDLLRPVPPTSGGPTSPGSPELTRNVADTAVHAVRTVLVQAGAAVREVFAVGLLEPARGADGPVSWGEVADRVAEQTGLTVLHGMRGRDRAAGGTGHPVTAAAEYLLFRHDHEDRLLVHLGAATGVLLVPAGAKVTGVVGFEAGPGNQLLDSLVYHGTRGRELADPGGKKAVQGCCLDPLLARWLEHPYLSRKPPKAVHPDAFGRAFLLGAFDAARQLGGGLPDLLCTATHLVARSVGRACRQWLPAAAGLRRVLLTGGGVRNGFLWQLLGQQFDGLPVSRADEAGVPPLARNAAAAAVLAALTCDGVAGNLPVLTGSAGGRLIGHLVPGDGRNWARCAAWIADQTGDFPRVNRAA
jgi:anhydro-N-acetylmuramic acid kinase